MKKYFKISMLALASACCLSAGAQNVKIKGVLENNRYDDGDHLKTTWIGSLYDEEGNYTGKTAFIVDQGIYAMTWNGTTLSTPTKEPAVNLSDIKQGSQVDYEKALWATNFNLMAGNSGAVYVDGMITTVFSRDYQSTVDEELFAVRQWDAKTGNLLNTTSDYMPVSANLESAGMSYNPKDGKVYGLFYMTAASLPSDILNSEDYFDDSDADNPGTDSGYCLCTIDLTTLEVTPITPGLYYDNYVAFAINSEGRAFALTSGGSNGAIRDDGKMENIDGVLSGAQLYEFDLTTGLKKLNAVESTNSETGEIETQYVNVYTHGTGYCSQYRRQSACFAKSNPNKMYWIGYFNSGKGINEYGSWSSLSDKEWRTNGKYDTCLYEVDITTGDAERVAMMPNRCTFSCLWIDGDDCSDGAGQPTPHQPNGIESAKSTTTNAAEYFSVSGTRTNGNQKGLQIVKTADKVVKVMK
ncbi:MAG: hypothetical protein IJ200_03905 [Prevotella sp.]|nr:hypothetical protein [Prevotella sp.]